MKSFLLCVALGASRSVNARIIVSGSSRGLKNCSAVYNVIIHSMLLLPLLYAVGERVSVLLQCSVRKHVHASLNRDVAHVVP